MVMKWVYHYPTLCNNMQELLPVGLSLHALYGMSFNMFLMRTWDCGTEATSFSDLQQILKL